MVVMANAAMSKVYRLGENSAPFGQTEWAIYPPRAGMAAWQVPMRTNAAGMVSQVRDKSSRRAIV